MRESACVWLAAVAAERSYRDPRWCTFETARQCGGYVRRGERGTPVLVWHRSGRPSNAPVAQPYKVFNAQQCGGLVEWEPESAAPIWQEERARRILRSSGALIETSRDGRARYDLAREPYRTAVRGKLPDPDAYLRTALHELGHWTGHPDRLNRACLTRGVAAGYGSQEYAREELRAGIASMMVGDRLELGHDTARHARFHPQWIEILRKDPLEIDRTPARPSGSAIACSRSSGTARGRGWRPRRRAERGALPGISLPWREGRRVRLARAILKGWTNRGRSSECAHAGGGQPRTLPGALDHLLGRGRGAVRRVVPTMRASTPSPSRRSWRRLNGPTVTGNRPRTLTGTTS